MIRVDRSTVIAPAILTKVDGPAAKERRRNEEYFRGVAKAKRGKSAPRKPTFTVYKKDEVKQALSALFKNKCAYCESVYAHLMSMEVEHWRPKGRVLTRGGKTISPGYYWLAAEWTNLLASCIDCNRERRQIDATTGERRKLGKADRFPLMTEPKRPPSKQSLARERPLLIDPSSEDPAQFIEFVLAPPERKAIVRARNNSVKGEASIEIFALNRQDLVDERRRYLVDTVEYTLANARKALQDMRDQPTKQSHVEAFVDAVARLERFCAPKSPYAALARTIINPELAAFKSAIAQF